MDSTDNNESAGQEGFVLLLDALGVKNLTIQESEDFSEKLDHIIEFVNKFNTPSGLKDTSDHPQASIKSFQDTLLVYWKSIKPFDEMIFSIGALLGQIISIGIIKGIRFRGAISYGRYIETNQGILGPAISDVAEWYDEADWIGIIATPTLGLKLELMNQQYLDAKEGNIEGYFLKYGVPFKSHSGTNLIKELWTVPWPVTYLSQKNLLQNKVGLSIESTFLMGLSQYNVPLGTESKYSNTMDFFHHYLKLHPNLGFKIAGAENLDINDLPDNFIPSE